MEKSNELNRNEEDATIANKISVKKETLNDDIKEFAETAMNELLGWYGYGNNRENRGCHSHSGSNSSGPESPKFNDGCGWCGKPVDETTALSSAAANFCSELCFSQSRRANFKKNKTCDWCRHVRHTVSYVESQDGASQLQFCSDKCLNQYKMHIFWRETRAHLEIHPHLHGEESSTSGTLITPDLWMNKCKSPNEMSPLTTSPPSTSLSPKLSGTPQQTSPLPLISVAHPSKLMSFPPSLAVTTPPVCSTQSSKRNNRKNQQNNRRLKKKLNDPLSPKNFYPEMPQDLRIRHTPIHFETISQNNNLPDMQQEKNLQTQVVTASTCGDACLNYFDSETPTLTSSSGNGINSNSSNINNNSWRKLFDGLLPPPTILVPYPIILPIPVPIPIPIAMPIPNSIYNKFSKEKNKFKEVSSQTENEEKLDNLVIEQTSSQDNHAEIEIIKESSCETTRICRPLRKRKITQPKPKNFKNKRLIST